VQVGPWQPDSVYAVGLQLALNAYRVPHGCLVDLRRGRLGRSLADPGK